MERKIVFGSVSAIKAIMKYGEAFKDIILCVLALNLVRINQSYLFEHSGQNAHRFFSIFTIFTHD